jgi:HD-GYP domain-containing protein (c-di-GMP phosphodiesterase class II)
LAARLAALADVYDALTTKRTYKGVYPHDKAVTIITGLSGTQFDPEVVDAFLVHQAEFARLAVELVDEPDFLSDRPAVCRCEGLAEHEAIVATDDAP